MVAAALSTGCFVQHEERLGCADLQAVELASHRAPHLPRILRALADSSARIVGVHCPCPNRGVSVDLAAPPERRGVLAAALHETMRLAASVEAEYVVVHAFYCFDGDLPADDVERMAMLRRVPAAADVSISEYRRAGRYGEARQRARQNLEALLPELKRAYPRQTILLENLNPRVGYGGIWLDEVTEIARELDGEVGVCLDVGHLALSAATLKLDMADAVRRAADVIRTLHLHQNFAGRYFADRHWNESAPRPDLQEVDLHLPLLARCTPVDPPSAVVVAPDNSAFADVLVGAVRYATPDGRGAPVDAGGTGTFFDAHGGRAPLGREGAIAGSVPVERLLDFVAGSAIPVLELDSRYAPLEDILAEYSLACRREHPVLH